jgi:C-terminal processing protease CtpA/Prc
MAKKEKPETCLNKIWILFLAITTVICAVIGASIYVKLDVLHKDLGFQADENKMIMASISNLHKKLDAYELKIAKGNKNTKDAWQIERALTSNSIVIKRGIGEYDQEKAFGGIGLKLRKGANSFIVVEVFDDLPAKKAGLYEGDEIVKINGESTAQMDQRDVEKKLRGPKGSTVDLSYKPSGSLDTIKEVVVTRDTIDLNKIKKGK